MSAELPSLAEQVAILRDEVLDTAGHGDLDPPGAEVFAAILRVLGGGIASADALLAQALTRRLAWGEREERVLADAEQVFDRLVLAADRAIEHPGEHTLVVEAAVEVAAATARVVALGAIVRAGRDRAQRLREELTQRQLEAALAQQEDNLRRLRAELPPE
ncbi:MAG: hypothetical protein R2939_21275 [Kofleriaceae bacterium]